MAARAETLAKEYEAKVKEATGVIQRLSDADWKKTTANEKWLVGVVAHHVASGHAAIAGLIRAVAGGTPLNLTAEALHEMNAKHAREQAACTKAETLALHEAGATAAAAAVRGLSDAELDRSGVVLAGRPAMSVEQIIKGILIHHMDEHVGSIRATAGQ